jgi:uncharacterized protein YbcI
MSDIASEIVSDLAERRNGGRDTHGELLLAVSNALVRLYKMHYGKGPTQARVYYQEDLLTCVLRDVHTRAEQTLIAAGRGESVRAQRDELHEVVAGDFKQAIEQITGRRVVGAFSAGQEEPSMTVETFVLAASHPRH